MNSGRELSSSGGETRWGEELKRQIRREYGSTISLRGYGERISDTDNYFEIDPHNPRLLFDRLRNRVASARKDAQAVPIV